MVLLHKKKKNELRVIKPCMVNHANYFSLTKNNTGL